MSRARAGAAGLRAEALKGEHMMRRTTTVAPLLALGLALLVACGGGGDGTGPGGGTPTPSPQKTVVALILCDVTSSLTKEENRRVGTLAAKVVESLPENATFKLFPIQIQTQVPTAIRLDLNEDGEEIASDYTIPELRSNVEEDDYAKVKKVRREQIEREVDKLYKSANKGSDNRTCIINALGFASNFFRTNYRDAAYQPELYLISDMVEECSNTPLPGKVVKLNKNNISAEIGLADKLPPGWDLSGVRIFCIFPAAADTPERVRPGREDVKRFWNTIFKKCGLKEGDVGSGITWDDSGEMAGGLRG